MPLYAEQLSKETVQNIEAFTSRLVDTRTAIGAASQVKRVFIKGIPRTALLKPNHAPFRLQAQRFELGDRVIMVQDSGNVPLSARGVVVGINSNSLEVVFDVPFLSGTTLNDRCAPYKGAAVSFVSVLNLTQPQFVCAGTTGEGDTSASVGSALEGPLDLSVVLVTRATTVLRATALMATVPVPAPTDLLTLSRPALLHRTAEVVVVAHRSCSALNSVTLLSRTTLPSLVSPVVLTSLLAPPPLPLTAR